LLKASTKKTLLICLPYAGGSSHFFYKWKRYLNPSVEIFPVEIAGRGRRSKDFFYNSFTEAVADIESIIVPAIQDRPYVLFGHSMGSLLAYELCCSLEQQGNPLPDITFVSGHDAPIYKKEQRNYHLLNDEQLTKKIIKMGGLSNEVAENDDLMRIFLPIARADFNMLDQYLIEPKTKQISVDLTLLYGTDDGMIKEKLQSWGQLTSGNFNMYPFSGGHFYLNEHEREVVDLINRSIENQFKIYKNYT
jgi:surfactin synthase thioesterase subunit